MIFILNGQNLPISSIQFIEKSLSNANIEKIELSEFNKTDFSNVWMKNQDAVIGFIGTDYQRIHIRLISITKNPYTENEYFVYGKSKTKSTVCDFQGKFKITYVRQFNRSEMEALYTEALKQDDKEAINIFKKVRGFILAEYYLFENPEQKGSGHFKGVIKSKFYKEEGKLFFDDIDMKFKDNFQNNQFLGVWLSYRTGLEKPCNWGTYRIPNAGDLDVGVGEFSPNTKYLDKGWDTYYRAYIKSESEARKDEETKWWK